MSKGKTKSKMDRQIDIRAALEEPVRISQNGKAQKVAPFEAVVRQHLRRSLIDMSI